MAAAIVLPAISAKAEITLKDTDRIVLFGDTSVSETYAFDWVDEFLRSKYPNLKAEFIRLGDTRCTVAEALRRFPIEVVPLQPTRIVLSFGTDEPQRKALDQNALAKYVKDMGELIDACRAIGAEVAVLTPPPPDESLNKGLKLSHADSVAAAHAEALSKLAAEKNVPVLDWYKATKDYLAANSEGPQLYWTKEGLIPEGLGVAIATDLLLAHWQAEPIDYMASAVWGSTEGASATTGGIKVVQANDSKMSIALTGVPVALNTKVRVGDPMRNWPLAKWCNYRLKITNMPESGVIISEGGKAAKPFLSQQLATGADMSIVGPMADSQAATTLLNAARTKLNQYVQFRLFAQKPVPEPELEEGYRLWAQAQLALAMATHKILLRTPSRFDITLDVELATPGKPNPAMNPAIQPKPAAGPKPNAGGPGRHRPNHNRPKPADEGRK